jgi:hypothetical protein
MIICVCNAFAQTRPVVRNYGQLGNSGVTTDNQGRPVKQNTGSDSLKHRDINEDSVTIFFRYFDSSRIRLLDSSLNDFYSKSGFPYHYYHLGNMGTAARSYLFSPNLQPGFDPGFHAFDIYKYTIEGTRFFQTTRPYTDLGYLLGGKGEQQINILHTQNRKSNFNLTFEYRLINSPGTYRNQNTSHNNVRLNTYYVSPRKRYSNYAILINNKLKASENGGLKNPALLDSLSLNDPFELETRLNGEGRPRRDFFNTNVSTGNSYNETYFYFRQHYDLGTKDSLVTDSITYRLFYPRIRFQHNFKYGSYKYRFSDADPVDSLYAKYFGYANPDAEVRFEDRFKEITNEFSVISFPEKNNLNQFLKLGAGFQLIRASFDTAANDNFSNVYFLGEYRNRTRNQKWEIEASGKLFTAGENAGDYNALISLKRDLGKRLGALAIGFENVNRTPSYSLRKDTAFPFKRTGAFSKENTSHAFASLTIPRLQLELIGDYYLLTNYTYMDNFFSVKQESTLFNVLHIGATKKFKLSRRWNLYSELHLQQTAGNPPVNVPLVFTRQRLAFEGNFFKNLDLSTGVEFRYHTPYKADNYSPFTGQFFFQDTTTISNRPDINLFFNFRIKRFTAYVRAENLNAFNINSNGARFSKPNFRAVNYPDALLWIRFGIWWKFIN